MQEKVPTQAGSPLGGMSQTQMFVFGIISGILVLCTIGFFILLGMMMNGGSFGSGNTNVAGPNVAPPTVNAGTGDSAQISVRPVGNDDHINGKKGAKVTIVEYADFNCGYCERFHPTMKQLMDAYGDQIQWVFRHFPILGEDSQTKALAAECAGEQGKFWEFSDSIYATKDVTTSVTQLALNKGKFDTCMQNATFSAKVQADAVDAQNAGASGTPYSVVVGPKGELVPLNGALPYAQVEAAILQFLN